jgi:hypothetical protein
MTKKTMRRSKKKARKYFTQVHEDAIIEYRSTTCPKRRTELYVNLLQPAFGEMVDKIVFTYKFTSLPNIDSLREECKIHLMTILDKFRPERGHKAFSYYSVITKNWFIQKVKKQQRRNQREINFEFVPKSFEEEYLSTDESWVREQIEREFWDSFYNSMRSWDLTTMRENDIAVYKAINILFESKDDIEIFNKKAVYLYLREITGLNTKQIVNSLSKFRALYSDFKQEWGEGQI